MNEAAKLIAESGLGEDFRTVLCGNKTYSIYPPTIKVIYRAIKELAKVNIGEEYTSTSVISEITPNAPHIIRAISAFIVGDVKLWRWKAHKVAKSLEQCTPKELNDALNASIELIQGIDFFRSATLAKNASQMVATQK